jgi:hypothetical protein
MLRPILGYLAFLFGWMAVVLTFLRSETWDRIATWCAAHVTENMVATAFAVVAVIFLAAWFICAIWEIEEKR